MPYDSNGIASLDPGYRATTGQTILASQHNPPLEDIVAMLSQCFLRSGIAPMNDNLNVNSFKVQNLGDGTLDGDAVNFSQLNNLQTTLTTLDTTLRALISASAIPTGARGSFFMQNAPAGWILGDGGTIGNAASGSVTRANADTEALFTLLWNNFTNALLPIYNSDGSVSSRGASAAVDFAASKRLRIFDLRTRYDRGADKGLNYDASILVGVTQADIVGPHLHSVDRTSIDTTGTTLAHSVGGSAVGVLNTSNSGAGIGTETRPRTVVSLHCIKL